VSNRAPLWKRMVGGLIGLAIVAALLLIARSKGASGAQIESWELAIVVGAGVAGLLTLAITRRKH